MMVERLAGLNGCEGIALCTADFSFIDLTSADFSRQAQTSHARVMRGISSAGTCADLTFAKIHNATDARHLEHNILSLGTRADFSRAGYTG